MPKALFITKSYFYFFLELLITISYHNQQIIIFFQVTCIVLRDTSRTNRIPPKHFLSYFVIRFNYNKGTKLVVKVLDL